MKGPEGWNPVYHIVMQGLGSLGLSIKVGFLLNGIVYHCLRSGGSHHGATLSLKCLESTTSQMSMIFILLHDVTLE